MVIFKFFPLFAFLLAGFWGLHQTGYFPDKLNHVLFHMGLPSGAVWKPTWSDLVILVGLVTLILKYLSPHGLQVFQ